MNGEDFIFRRVTPAENHGSGGEGGKGGAKGVENAKCKMQNGGGRRHGARGA